MLKQNRLKPAIITIKQIQNGFPKDVMTILYNVNGKIQRSSENWIRNITRNTN